MYIYYISRSGAFIPVPDTYVICPWRKGIISTWERLQIYFEFLSAHTLYKLHTIEVNNIKDCNVNIMNGLRRNLLQQPFDDRFLNSQLLRGRPVIDIDYLEKFEGLSTGIVSLDILEINFLETIDGKNPGSCELRAFVEII